ncbi:Sec-independent protein translocase subunit TatA [Streptomyces sp. MMG1121]|uniref:Sec-independent protein translocase subunit TatA n=1 Tax=Streptomyces sp. MMG1121 TaxID=1415544 RepID=UPI0006AFBE44|nr:Sec-independent protein translocase subunit TatA [Streptomyces sp. MMG1121]KOV58837.1 hypothetical protein ADK64_35380 [Streptomyces sp. MMG1121]
MLRNGLEPWQLLVVAVVIILLSGAKKLPEAARGLGRSLHILRNEGKAMKDEGGAQPSASEADGASDGPALRIIRSTPAEAATGRPSTERNRAR